MKDDEGITLYNKMQEINTRSMYLRSNKKQKSIIPHKPIRNSIYT